jgi:putative ABC transport system substrate-binding protein
LPAFRKRLAELGWIEGYNLTIEERWAKGDNQQIPVLMAELVGRKVDLIATGSVPAAIAAKRATSTIPIVMLSMGDPLRTGVVSDLARPGGNLTGLSLGQVQGFAGKWLELLREAAPGIKSAAVMTNPASPLGEDMAKELKNSASSLGLKLQFINVSNAADFEPGFKLAQRDAQGLVVLTDPLTFEHQHQITDLALRHRVPAIYTLLEFVDSGGLMAYGADHAKMGRRAAEYVDKILRGAKPGDLPIEQPAQFSLAVNLKTAKGLRITIPESILLRADEVIR